MPMQPKKGVGIMIAVGRPRGGSPPPDLDEPGRPLSKRNNEQETPDEEKQFHEQGKAPRATPVSVGYRTESETCRSCEYNGGGECSFLSIPVSDGDSCMRFEAKAEDEESGIAEHDNGGAGNEYEEAQ